MSLLNLVLARSAGIILTFTTFAALAISALVGTPGACGSELVLLGVYEQSSPVPVSSTANTSFTPGSGFGGGLQLTAKLTRVLELELGAAYTQRAWNDTLSGNLLMPAIDLPVGFRLRPFRWFALDGGGYYSSINAQSRVAYISTVDYGIYGGATLMIPFSSRAGLFLAGRYLYGLANVSLVGGQLGFRGIEGLAGFQINLSVNH